MFNRRDLLFGTAACTLVGAPALAQGVSDRRLIVVLASGGWDVTMTLDPKVGRPLVDGPEVDEDPDNPDDREALATFGDLEILTNPVKRPSVTRFFQNNAARTAVINGIFVGSIGHQANLVRMLTGTFDERHADMATIAGHVLGRDLPLGCIDMGNQGYKGPLAASVGTLGFRGQLKALVDPTFALPGPVGSGLDYPLYRPTVDHQDAARAWLDERARLYGEAWTAHPGAADKLADLRTSRERARRFRDGATPQLAGLEMGRSPSLETQLDVALDLLDAGMCRSILVDTTHFWDTHQGNASQHAKFEDTFANLDRLAAELDARGVADRTTVVVISEMTRTPRLNERGGKDHWQHTSALAFGAGVAGGRAFGATNDLLESMPVALHTGEPHASGDYLAYGNFAAGVLALVGVDPAEWYPGVTPFTGFLS